MCLALFLYLFGSALYDLRARSAAPEVMAVGLALLGLAFSHPIGAAIAFAAVPFLIFAVRPVLVASSAFNVVVALVFPTVFSRRRLRLFVLGLSRRRLELLCGAVRKPVGLERRRRPRVRRRFHRLAHARRRSCHPHCACARRAARRRRARNDVSAAAACGAGAGVCRDHGHAQRRSPLRPANSAIRPPLWLRRRC